MLKVNPPQATQPVRRVWSGYASEVAPELLSAEERAGRAVPRAEGKGHQAGRVAPAKRKTVNYKAVTAADADKLLRDRSNGKAPLIEGGLDDAAREKPEPKTQYEDTRMEDMDSPEEVATRPTPTLDLTNLEDLQALLQMLKPHLAAMQPVEHVGLTKQAIVERAPVIKQAAPIPQPARKRVSMEIENAGTYSIPAIDVVEAGYGVFVVLPCGSNDAVFTPTPGASVRVLFDGKVHDCYFPGVAGELPGLNVMVLALVTKPAE